MDFTGKSPAQAAEMIVSDIRRPGHPWAIAEKLIVDVIQQFSNRELERRRELQEEVKALRRDVLAIWTPRPRLAKLLGVSKLPTHQQMCAAEKRIESLLNDEARLNFEIDGKTLRAQLDAKVIIPALTEGDLK